MNIIDPSNQSIKRDNIEYFIQLIRIAIADDMISNNELALLHRIGKKTGFTDQEIDNFIETTGKSNFISPAELSKRFEQVYDIVKMVLADGVIDKNEMRLASSFAANSGFKESEIPNLLVLLITGIKQGIDEEELFETYRIAKKS